MNKSKQQTEIEQLEHAFWKSLIDNRAGDATGLLTEPSMMVSGHGAMTFDHAAYTKMATNPKNRVVDYDISEMEVLFPNDEVAIASYRVHQKLEMDGKKIEMDVVDSSTWVKIGGKWKCAAHTECPKAAKA